MFSVQALRRVIRMHAGVQCVRPAPAPALVPPPSAASIQFPSPFQPASSFSSTRYDPREPDGGVMFDTIHVLKENASFGDVELPSKRDSAPDSLTDSTGTFRRTNATGILTPRMTRTTGTRVDDPQAANMIQQINQINIKSKKDESVPVGTPSSTPKARPQKGGRAIHPADVIEQRGKLTPMQMHRILTTLQQADASWPIEKIALAYDVSEATILSVKNHLTLPFVFKDSDNTWQGTVNEPTHVLIQRALGNDIRVPRMGDHIKIEKSLPK